MRNKSTRISIFLMVSLGWSFLWFSQKYKLSDFFDAIDARLVILFGLVPTLGLLLGSSISKSFLADSEMTILGNKPKLYIVFSCIPIACLTLFGVDNSFGIQTNLFGFLIGLFTLLYTFLEEFGWRGYLFDELKSYNSKWLSAIVIGLIWYLWHWFFLREGGSLKSIMIPILIVASFGIGEIAKSTKSILVCGAVHSLANMIFLYPIIAKSINNYQKTTLLVVCIIFWGLILRKYSNR